MLTAGSRQSIVRSRLHKPPRRPPDSQSRSFNRHTRLHLLSPHTTRPQPTYLSSSSPSHQHLPDTFQWQRHRRRLLTTERRARIKYEGRVILGHVVICLAATFAVVVVIHSILEESKPSPREWSMWSRMAWQRAHAYREKKVGGGNLPSYLDLNFIYKRLLGRLEDPNGDGAGLVLQRDPNDEDLGNVGMGFDVTGKSAEWRQGYYDCLLGYAEACEHVQEWFRDKKTGKVSPRAHVVGPSNPDPVDAPPLAAWLGVKPAREEDVEPAAPLPETVYVKILTTKGFNSKQRVDAAIAYGNWLDFKGLHDSAEEAYHWALDIAMAGVHDAAAVIDPRTMVVKAGMTRVSENILNAATALATHFASTAEPAPALPIYLSVLRARRKAPAAGQSRASISHAQPVTPTTSDTSRAPGGPASNSSTPQALTEPLHKIWNWIVSQTQEKPFPLLELSGNEPFVRRNSPIDACEDAKLMGYIGEIVFATSTSEKEKADAVTWVEDAIDEANKGLEVQGATLEEKLKCLDCRQVELDNLLGMTKRLAAMERDKGQSNAEISSFGWISRLTPWAGRHDSDRQAELADHWQIQWREAKRRHDENGREDMRSRLTITPAGNLWGYARKFLFI